MKDERKDRAKLLERLARTYAKPGEGLASLQVLVLCPGEAPFELALGFGHIDTAYPERNRAIDMDSKFRAASISKPVTALGAMILVDEGLLDLDSDLSGYLGFVLRNPAFPDTAITAAMLLSHTSSLRDDDGYSLPFPQRLVDHVGPDASGRGHWAGAGDHADSCGRDLSPGNYFCYCNLNYGVLATVMERLSGRRFDLYMRERVFEPLGIDAGYNVLNLSDAGFARLSTLYRAMDRTGRWDAQGPWYPQIDDYGGQRPSCGCRLEEGHGPEEAGAYEPGTNGSLFGPQGGLRISARDLGTILRLFLNSGEVDGVRIVSEHAMRLMMTSRWTWNPEIRNASLYGGSTRESGLGLMRIAGVRDELGGDRLLPAGGHQPWCHHADAWGLLGGFTFDIAEGWAYVYLIGGTQAQPVRFRGSYSSWYRCEEEIQAAIIEECIDRRYRTGLINWRNSFGEFGAWDFDGVTMGKDGLEVDWPNARGLQLLAPVGGEVNAIGGMVVSPVLETTVPAFEAIPSWNARSEAGKARIDVRLRARIEGHWTGWYGMGSWSEGGGEAARFSIRGQKDEWGEVRTDTLVLKQPADAFQLCFVLASLDGDRARPGPLLVNAGLAWSTRRPEGGTWTSWTSRGSRACALSVPGVPAWSQMLYPDGGSTWCSATCLAMILEGWRRTREGTGGVEAAEEASVRSAVAGVFDPAWGGCGNWAFNIAHAGACGCDAFVVRYTSLDRLEALIAAGIPLALSVSWDNDTGRVLTNAPLRRSSGHLTLLVGFDAKGDPLMHEPASLDNAGVPRTYRRAELEARWLEASGGATYVIVPRGRAIPGIP